MKYVVLNLLGEERLFTFPNIIDITHRRMVEAIQYMKVDDERGDWDRSFVDMIVVSAGFITPSGVCHGISESLGVKARPDKDYELFKSQFKGW